MFILNSTKQKKIFKLKYLSQKKNLNLIQLYAIDLKLNKYLKKNFKYLN